MPLRFTNDGFAKMPKVLESGVAVDVTYARDAYIELEAMKMIILFFIRSFETKQELRVKINSSMKINSCENQRIFPDEFVAPEAGELCRSLMRCLRESCWPGRGAHGG